MLTATRFTDLSVQMTGRVVTPSDPDWDATRQVFNLATDLRPAAVAYGWMGTRSRPVLLS
jgi:hypothetical protein